MMKRCVFCHKLFGEDWGPPCRYKSILLFHLFTGEKISSAAHPFFPFWQQQSLCHVTSKSCHMVTDMHSNVVDWLICLSLGITGMRAFHWHFWYSLVPWNVYQWSLAGYLDAHSASLGLAEDFRTFLNLFESVAQVKAHHRLLDRLLLV